ncbi:MAG: ComEC/Rec2 family competence protein, partial [Myxococcota bacterium]
MSAPVVVALERDGVITVLPSVLSGESALLVRLPAGLSPGLYSVSVETTSGASKLLDSLRVVDDPLRIEVLKAGQGDSQVVTSPSGVTVLIDGSISSVGATTLRGRFLVPPDYVVISHYDADHLGGVYSLLAGPDLLPNTEDDVEPNIALLDHGDNHSCGSRLCVDFLAIRDRLAAIGKARIIEAGEEIDLGAGVRATCVLVNGDIPEQRRRNTSRENENSVGLFIDFLGFRYLTAGDVTGGAIPGCSAALAGNFVDVETPLARLTGPLDVLKVAHHGSCTATPLTFSALAMPQVGIVSLGENNAFCHPSQRVLRNLAHGSTDLYLTSPGVSDPNNASACPLTALPDAVARFYSDVRVEVPGDGTFSVHVGLPVAQGPGIDVSIGGEADGGSGAGASDGGPAEEPVWYRKTYRVRSSHPDGTLQVPLVSASGSLEFVGDPGAHPVGDDIQVRSAAPWLEPVAYLVPAGLATDQVVMDLEEGYLPSGLIEASITLENESLFLRPLLPLSPNASFLLVIPSTTTGSSGPSWITFGTSLLWPPGPGYELAPLPASASGVVTNLPGYTVEFTEPVRGVAAGGTSPRLFLEELDTGAERIVGTATMSSDATRVTIALPQGPRTGPSGEACHALCPHTKYAVRAMGAITNAAGAPIDTAILHTFETADCTDSSLPTVASTAVRTFPQAASISLFADEPLQGRVELAEGTAEEFDCAAMAEGACVTLPLRAGTCSGDPCQPSAGACHFYALAEGLKMNTPYAWRVYASDLIGNEVLPQSGLFDTSVPDRTLILQEVLADS